MAEPFSKHVSPAGAYPGTTPSKYEGMAPGPQRAANLTNDGGGPVTEINITHQGVGVTPVGLSVEPPAYPAVGVPETSAQPMAHPEVAPLTGVPGVQSAPSPDNPEVLQRLIEQEATLKELRAELQREREARERTSREQQLLLQAQAAAQRAGDGGSLLPPLPEDLAAKDLTMADFHNLMRQLIPAMESNVSARTLRAQWDVSQEEELAVYRDYPSTTSLPEPERTKFIWDMARLRRPTANTASGPAPEPAAPVSLSQAARPARVAAPTVPYVEATLQPSVGDARPVDELSTLRRQYDELSRSPAGGEDTRAQKERLWKMRQVADRIKALQGVTLETEKASQFIQRL